MPSDPISESYLTELLTVGTRVVLRCRLAPSQVEAGGPTLTDVVGDVTEVTDNRVVLETRRGPVPVDRASVVLAKRIPQPPPRRAPRRAIPPTPPPTEPTTNPSLSAPTTNPPRVTASSPSDGRISPSVAEEAVTRDELQVVMVAGMPPLDSARVGDWLLRAANGYTGRANSALAVGDPGIPLSEAVDRVTAWYAEHDQPALIQLPHAAGTDPTGSKLGMLLAQRNWRFFLRSSVLVRPSPRVTASSASDGRIRPSLAEEAVTRQGAGVEVVVSPEPTNDWWAAGSPRALEHRSTLTRMLARIPHGAYLTAYLDGRPVGHLRLAFSSDWSGVFDVHTDPAARGRGVARALMHQAGVTASERRIPLQYLQVAADNDAAVQLYRSLDWQVHHEYHYANPGE